MDSELKLKVNKLEDKNNKLTCENDKLKMELSDTQNKLDSLIDQINKIKDDLNDYYETGIQNLLESFELFDNKELMDSLNEYKDKNSIKSINNMVQNIQSIIQQIIDDTRIKKQMTFI